MLVPQCPRLRLIGAGCPPSQLLFIHESIPTESSENNLDQNDSHFETIFGLGIWLLSGPRSRG